MPGRMTQDSACVTDRTEQQPGNTAIQPVQKTTDQSESVVNHMMVNEPFEVSQDGENEFSRTHHHHHIRLLEVVIRNQ